LNRLLAASLYSPYVNSIGIFEGKLNLEYACFVPFEENSLCTPCLLHSIIPMRILIWGKLVRFLSKKTCIAYIMLV